MDFRQSLPSALLFECIANIRIHFEAVWERSAMTRKTFMSGAMVVDSMERECGSRRELVELALLERRTHNTSLTINSSRAAASNCSLPFHLGEFGLRGKGGLGPDPDKEMWSAACVASG